MLLSYPCFKDVVSENIATAISHGSSPLFCGLNPKENQPWIFIGRIDAETEAPILWPPDVKSRLIRKDPDAGKDWGQEEKGETEDDMIGWHHRLDGHEFEQALGDSEGQGSLSSCNPWGSQSWTWLRDWTTTINQYLGFLGILHQHTMSCYVLRLFPKQCSHDLKREGKPQIMPELPWGGWALQATLNWKKTFRLTKFLLRVNGIAARSWNSR